MYKEIHSSEDIADVHTYNSFCFIYYYICKILYSKQNFLFVS